VKAIDTNLLVRLLTRDDPPQVAAAERFIERGAWVSLVVLVESIWVMGRAYRRTPEQLLQIVDGLLHSDRLILQNGDVVMAALDLFRSKPALGFSDCLVIELARQNGHLPLGTFDKNLGKVPGAERI
jgi:predicted nucleic-acid-binding protein